MCKCWYIRIFVCYVAVPVQYPEQYGHVIQALYGRTGTVSWTIRPSHSGVMWPYRYSILNNTAISFRCYVAVPVQYPEQYSHLIQVLCGRTGTVSWTIWPSHSGVMWLYRYSILNNTAISFRRKIWSSTAVTVFLSKSNDTTKGLLKTFHVFLKIQKLHAAYLFTLQRWKKKGTGHLSVLQHCCLEAYCTLTQMSSFIHLQRRCTHQAAWETYASEGRNYTWNLTSNP